MTTFLPPGRFASAVTVTSNPAERVGLSGRIGGRHTAETDRASAPIGADGRRDNIAALDLGEFFDQRSGRISQTRPVHPLGQGFPQDMGQEADKDMGQNAILLMVPDRADHQFIGGNAEGPFRLGQLDVAFPQGAGSISARFIRNR